ncbi:unnamed protein product [Brassica napus]|uniref:(rape) hypothetical protein n=1 Tax=Brassica napus TaxID=3708 RepID=A0A816KJS9_BRANA|nr:unnamed protein product [Brassica napus]
MNLSLRELLRRRFSPKLLTSSKTLLPTTLYHGTKMVPPSSYGTKQTSLRTCFQNTSNTTTSPALSASSTLTDSKKLYRTGGSFLTSSLGEEKTSPPRHPASEVNATSSCFSAAA